MKFYIRSIGIFAILFPSTINLCLVFNNINKPYIIDAASIRGNLEYLEINI